MGAHGWLVVGLGNPGPRYASTRHNAGSMAAAVLAGRAGIRLQSHRRVVADAGQGHLPGQPGPALVIAVPRSYMNTSGGPVAGLLSYYRVDLGHLVVLHDELDLPLGEVRLKQGGSDAGHNGLRSIRAALGSGEYLRCRIGIGRPPAGGDTADYVLAPFPPAARPVLTTALERAADAVELLLTDGLAAAQQRFHSPLTAGA